MSELKPCPICGGKATVLEEAKEWFKPACLNAKCPVDWTDCYFTEAEAIEAWNTRAAYEMDGFFYLPKPKQRLFNYTTGFSFDDMSLKSTGSVDVYALVEAVQKWQEEALSKHIVERICEVFKPEQTCENASSNKHEFKCSACGDVWRKPSVDLFRFCPSCGARITGGGE